MLISLLTCSAISALGMVTVGSNLCTNFILGVFFFFFLFLPLFFTSRPACIWQQAPFLKMKTKSNQNLKGNLGKSLFTFISTQAHKV